MPAEQVVGPGYLITASGYFNCIEAFCSFLAVLLVGINFHGWHINMFVSASAISLVLAVFLLSLYLSGVAESIASLPLNRILFFVHLTLAIYYVISVALVLQKGHHNSRLIAGSVFGLVSIISHILDSFYNFNKHRLC